MDLLTLVAHNALSFIVIISVIVFIHEFGHYFVAKLSGVRIETFSIGFGPELFGWNDRSGTRWKVSAFPLGGYVKMFGDNDAASTPDNDAVREMSEEERRVAFPLQPLRNRFAIVAAGPVANFILAVFVFTFLFAYYGRSETLPVIGEVMPESAAAEAGLQAGDIILEIDSHITERFEDIVTIVQMHGGQELPITYERNGEKIVGTITPQIVNAEDLRGNSTPIGRIGVTSGALRFVDQMPIWQAFTSATVETYQFSVLTLKAIGQMITGERPADQISGILRIGDYSGQFVEKSFSDENFYAVLRFMAIISINLGLINLFPIPMLDGGHLFFYIIEGLRGKPLNEKAQEVFFRLGFTFIILLMVFATYNDLKHFGIF